MGGMISVESGPGKGTHIRIEVPLSVAALRPADHKQIGPDLSVIAPLRAEPEKPENPRPTDQRQIRTLVVDDHAMVRQGLATMISEDDRMTVVAEASDGIEAIEAVEKHQPDVILIDVNMPRMNGIEATREICRRWPESIVIGLSVQDDQTTANLMRRAGAKAFLSKGGNADQMIGTIVTLRAEVTGKTGAGIA